MIMILIVGGIGSGKSVLSRILRLNGYGVFDCDMEASMLMENSPDVIKDIRNLLGERAYIDSGLNREFISEKIFNDEELRNRLNGIVHSAVRRRIKTWLEENPKNLFVESAIASQSGLTDMAQKIILICAHKEIRTVRIMERNGFSEEKIERIMTSQQREEEEIMASGIPVDIIDNSGDLSVLKQLESVLGKV